MYYATNAYPEANTHQTMYKLDEKPFIHPSCLVKNSMIGSWAALGEGTRIVDSSFGDYSYTAGNVSIIYSIIGKFCSIANSVRINPGNHPQWRVTQHHCTYRRIQYGFDSTDDEGFFQWRRQHACEIGHDVWIGHGATILPGVKIGTGAVIGAGAVVTKDVQPYQVMAGVPAKHINWRFPENVAPKLLAIAWWEWPRETLEERFNDLLDLETFLEKYA